LEGADDGKEVEMKTHLVEIELDRGKPKCVPDRIEVEQGDEIEWKGKPDYPFGVFVVPFDSPLEKAFHCAQKGELSIKVKVKGDALPGKYRYAVGTSNGKKFRSRDPEIIVVPPKRGG
jgi:plastocyanin